MTKYLFRITIPTLKISAYQMDDEGKPAVYNQKVDVENIIDGKDGIDILMNNWENAIFGKFLNEKDALPVVKMEAVEIDTNVL